MNAGEVSFPSRRWFPLVLFVVLQVGIALLATSNESLWIDEFWTAYFASLGSIKALFAALSIPFGSQTPLHFLYYFVWGHVFPLGDLSLRLANLPLFVLGQLALFVALRRYPARFALFLLAASSLHPLVWQYMNEARPYIMLYAGSQMVMAYIVNLHGQPRDQHTVDPLFTAILALGLFVLYGASLIGAFWVFFALVYIAWQHYRVADWRYLTRGVTAWVVGIFLVAAAVLTLYYVNSLLQGAGASRLASTSASTVLFDGYELLGLSGLGPGRLELRGSGIATLRAYFPVLIPAGLIVLGTPTIGLIEAVSLRGKAWVAATAVLALAPLAIVILSGFVMHWRVLGRHLIAAVPVFSVLIALGLSRLTNSRIPWARVVGAAVAALVMLVFAYSSLSVRFAERHRKDDYRTAARLAREEIAGNGRVWWAADYLGAHYYGVPGEFDFMGEVTNEYKPPACKDVAGAQPVSDVSAACLEGLSVPSMIVLSKPESFDQTGAIAAYLDAHHFDKSQELPAFSIWQARKN